jgi:hypothetical protein
MATYYVSKRDGNNSNNGTSTRTPVADLWKGFELAEGSNGDTIEIIDSETYYIIDGDSGGTGSLGHATNGTAAYPHGDTIPAFKNFTLKAGTDPNTSLESYPVISGKLANESGSASDKSVTAFSYQEGWTIQGLEIRDFTTSVAIPKTGTTSKAGNSPDAVAGDPTLIIKDCLIHHIPDRSNSGNSNGCIVYASDCGDETTNVVENCIFYEIGYTVIGGASTEDVTIRNCLMSNWGGNGTANIKGIHLNSTGSVVEHCIISDYENKTAGTSPIHLSGKGTIRHTIANNLTGDANGIFYTNSIVSCVANNCSTQGQSVADSSGSVFNAGSAARIQDSTVDPSLVWSSGSDSSGYFDSGRNSITSEEIGNFITRAGYPPFYYTSAGGDGLNQASGSIVTRDLGDTKWIRAAHTFNNGRKRNSSAALEKPDIGCWQFYRDFVPTDKVTSKRVADDFTINNANSEQRVNEHTVRYDDKGTNPPAVVPISKTIKGPPSLRKIGSSEPYKLEKG